MGASFTANLTPDDETGLGKWTAETFIADVEDRPARRQRPAAAAADAVADDPHAHDEDLRAVFAYLQSLPPIRNRVPAPVDPDEQ